MDSEKEKFGKSITLSDGRKFMPEEFYFVAINSYRGNGGGGHLTSGAGIPKKALSERIVWSSERDLRYYLMNSLMKSDTLHPTNNNNWRCIPESYRKRGEALDKLLLLK